MQRLKSLYMPLMLVAVVSGALWGGEFLALGVKAFFYAISLGLKEILTFILPVMIFTFVLRSLLKLGKGAISFVALLVPMIVLSNLTSTCLAFELGTKWLEFNCFSCQFPGQLIPLEPAWLIKLPQLVSNDVALASGLLAGVMGGWRPQLWLERFSTTMFTCVEWFLKAVFVPLIPLFIFGFALNLQQSGVLSLLITNYTSVLLGVLILCFGYILLLYGVLQGFRPHAWLQSLHNMLPAALTGLSTMSSAAAMPLTLLGTAKNVDDPRLIQTVVPATVNVHLMGDCFAIPIFGVALLVTFNQGLPSWPVFMVFAFYFVLAKFAVAAVPGGGVLVMLPILENYLGFTPEMLSLITALYILFDPIITSANVFGNGVFAQAFAKIYKKIGNYKGVAPA
jgi:hypothetical protein